MAMCTASRLRMLYVLPTFLLVLTGSMLVWFACLARDGYYTWISKRFWPLRVSRVHSSGPPGVVVDVAIPREPHRQLL
jgi:hypothetical protein